MSLWIKVCGNTTLADAQMAADTGADALGFIFAPSPRRVTPDQVATITPHLSSPLEKIGVFVDASFAEIAAAVEQCGLTGVQLHTGVESAHPAQLRVRFGPALRVLEVIHFGDKAAGMLKSVSSDPNVDGILIDSRTATAPGGTGIAYDWQAARAQLFDGQSRLKLIAAGGLNPSNVAEAIATLEPWGVDVVTGVESLPGRKDPEKLHAFIANARAAAAQRTALRVH